MDRITELFDRMDAWRHFPHYELERRADLFFALYLPEVLEAKLGFPVQPELAPELPVAINNIYIDYVALSSKADKAVFVELKTDGRARRPKQDKDLIAAQKAGLTALLGGVLKLFRATTRSKRKYFCLLEHLESMGLLRIPTSMKDIMRQRTLQGATEASHKIEITAKVQECLIVYVQPNGTGRDVISFDEFAEVVRRHDDPVSRRFAASLSEWAKTKAGGQPANE